MGGRCGICGHMFIVYAQYLFLINAVLMSAVIDTSEQRLGLTQCVDGLPPDIRGLGQQHKASSGLSREDRCSRKIHTNPKTVNLRSHYSSRAPLLWKASSCFQHALQRERKFKDVFSIVTHVFPQMKARDSDAERLQGSAQGLFDLLLRGYAIQPISAIGLLFWNDLLTNK